LSGWPPLDLVTILIFLSADNVIANIKIWTGSLHDSFGKLSHLSNKTRMRSFGLLELEIWAEQWTVSGLQLWSNNWMVLQFEFNQHFFSKLSPLFVFSISLIKLINQSFDLCDRPVFKINIYHKLNVSYIIRLIIIKHAIVKELLILQV